MMREITICEAPIIKKEEVIKEAENLVSKSKNSSQFTEFLDIVEKIVNLMKKDPIVDLASEDFPGMKEFLKSLKSLEKDIKSHRK